MAKAYYPDNSGKYLPWTADMVGAVPLYSLSDFALQKVWLGTFTGKQGTRGELFTLNCHFNHGYNGGKWQGQEAILRFNFGRGGAQYGEDPHFAYVASIPCINDGSTQIQYYYTVEGPNVNVYMDLIDVYLGVGSCYSVACSDICKWEHKGVAVNTIPEGSFRVSEMNIYTSYAPEIVVSSTQPTTSSAKVWVKI